MPNDAVTKILDGFKTYNIIPDIICLNEVLEYSAGYENLNSLAKGFGSLANITSPYSIHFYGHVRNLFGNAILFNPFKLKVQSENRDLLPGGTQIKVKPGQKKLDGNIRTTAKVHRIVRGIVKVNFVFRADNYEFELACTHLDHIVEDERRVQLNYIVKEVFTKEDIGQILIGDLNCLDRTDYSQPEWEFLEGYHKNQGWSPPPYGALDILYNRGFLDTFKLLNREDLAALSPSSKFTSSVDYPKHRIDYLFATKKFLDNFVLTHAFVAKRIKCSDHFPVCFDFRRVTGKGSL